MKKISKNKLITVIFNVILIVFCSNTVLAATVVVPKEVTETLTNLTKILLLIATAVCVGKVIHIGILYLTSTAMDKSTAKQAILPWIIGTIVSFGAATIGGAIIEIIQGALEKAGIAGVLDY